MMLSVKGEAEDVTKEAQMEAELWRYAPMFTNWLLLKQGIGLMRKRGTKVVIGPPFPFSYRIKLVRAPRSTSGGRMPALFPASMHLSSQAMFRAALRMV